MRQHREQQESIGQALGKEVDPDDLIFTWPDGRPMLPGSVSHGFKKIARQAGLGEYRLHDLRHTHATLMLLDGIHPKVVQERLGHSSIVITLDVYSHVIKGMQEAAALRFDEALAQAIPVSQAADSSRHAPLTIR